VNVSFGQAGSHRVWLGGYSFGNAGFKLSLHLRLLVAGL
jgi:hypothetical protein